MWKLYISKKKNLKYLSDLINLIQKDSIFKEFYYFDKIPSTQDLAFKIIKRKKIIRPSVIICNSQTMGKGRNRLCVVIQKRRNMGITYFRNEYES